MTSNPEIKTISVVIPVYNGAQTIGKLVDELAVARLFPGTGIEVVLINDCSADNSEEVCIAIQEKYPEIVSFFSLSINVGEHNAVMAGLNMATGDYAVIMDDDFQNPVSEVARLTDFMLNHNYDVVYSYYDEKKHSLFRNLGSRFNNMVANIMLKKPRHLYLSSFKIINRFLIGEIVKYDLPFPYIDGLILQITSNIGKIKVEHDSRKHGKSNYTIHKLLSLWMNMFTNFSVFPLRFATIIGFLFSIFGFIMVVDAVIEKIYNPHVPLGYPSLIFIISIFAGVQLVAIGMVGEYLGRLFIAKNKKPQFSIRRSFRRKAIDGKK